MSWFLRATLSALFLTALVPPYASVQQGCDGIACIDDEGAYVSMSLEQTRGLAIDFPPGASVSSPTAWYVYSSVIACAANVPEGPEHWCLEATQHCAAATPPLPGPFVNVFRRVTSASGAVGSWEPLGPTCFAGDVPARSGAEPDVLEGAIRSAFRRIPFTPPVVGVQPPNNRTLVRLPNYFVVEFPGVGTGPGETSTVDLLGHRVSFRVRVASVVYDFGDGQTAGPTGNLGGRYPDGTLTHAYARKSTFTPVVSVQYTADVSVDGGPARPVGQALTMTATPGPIEVLTTRTRLVS